MNSFSRRVLWLELGITNKDSSVIARYYVGTVAALGGQSDTCMHVLQNLLIRLPSDY